jgi:hypothetical protein
MGQQQSDINRLLSANRRLTRLCLLQAAVLGAMTIVGWQYKTNELTLTRLAIVDSTGHERVVLRGGDGAGVVVYDSEGHTRSGLTVDHDLPGLRLYDGLDHPLAGLVVNPTGPNLDFLRPDGSYIERHPAPTPRMLR